MQNGHLVDMDFIEVTSRFVVIFVQLMKRLRAFDIQPAGKKLLPSQIIQLDLFFCFRYN